VTPDINAAFSPKPAIRSTCEDYRELIEQGLARGRNGKAIWQDLVSENGYGGSYQAVKRLASLRSLPSLSAFSRARSSNAFLAS
jgi:hypothetical protein